MKPMGGGLLENASLAFRYLCQWNVVPDPGIEKTEENREIVDIVNNYNGLSAEDLEAIEKSRAEFGQSWCHRCDYCQPCPQKIDINMVINVKSVVKRMTIERARQFAGAAVENAGNCTECGGCMSRCPYKLEIPSLLKERIKYWNSL
jgi:predicted aldo/keto reductase-like oxidoreductase